MLVTKLIGAPKNSDSTFSSTVLLINGDVYTNFTQTDISNSQLPLTPSGNPQSSQFSPFNGDTYSVKFKTFRGDTGTNDLLRIAGNVLELGKADWTMECFFMPVFEVEDNSTIICNDNFRWGFDSTNIFISVNSVANDNNTVQYMGNFAHGMLPNQWYHLVITNSKGTISFYVNSKLLGTDFSSSIPTAGNNNYVTMGPMNGYLSQMRVVKNSVQYYGSSFDIPTQSLSNQLNNPAVANFIDPNATVSLLCCQSKTLVDNSGLNNSIVSQGSPVITDGNPFSNSYEEFLYSSQSTYFHNNYSLTNNNYGYGIPLIVVMMEDLGASNDFTMETWAYQSSSDNHVKLSLWFFSERYKDSIATVTGTDKIPGYSSNNYTGKVGDGYRVGATLYIWNGSAWINAGTNGPGYLHIYLSQGRLYLQTGYAGHSVGTIPYGFAHPSPGVIGKWNHVAFVRKSGVYYLFFNGVMSPITDNSTVALFNLGPRFLVATDNTRDRTNGTLFDRGDGKITNMRIIKNQALFTDDFTVSTMPLRKDTVGHSGSFTQNSITGKVLFLGFQNAALKDNSGLNAQIGFGGVIPYYQYPALTDAGTKASYIPRHASVMDPNFSDSRNASRNLVWYAPAGGVSINHMQANVQLSTLTNPSFTMEVWAYGPTSYIVSGGSGIYNTYYRSSGVNGYNAGDLYPYMWYWKAGEFSWLEAVDYKQPDYTKTGSSIEFLDKGYLTVDSSAGSLGSGNWTIELWWQSSGVQRNNATIVGKDNGAGNNSWLLKITGYTIDGAEPRTSDYRITAQVGIQFLYYNNEWTYISTSPDLCDNIHDGKWHHIAVTRVSNVITIFMDGFVMTTASNIPSNFDFGSSLSNNLNIGYNNVDTTDSYIYGRVSNLRIVKGKALYTTPNDIYTGQAAFEPPSSILPVVSGTNYSTILLIGQGATPLTEVTNNLTVTTNGTTNPVAVNIGPWSPVNYKFATSTRNYANIGLGLDSDNNVISVWNHFAVSVNAGNVTMYLNGQPDTMTGNLAINQIAQKDSLGDNLVLGSVWKQYGNYNTQVPMTNLRIVRNQALFSNTFTVSSNVLTKYSVGHSGANAASQLTGTVMLLLTDSNIDSSDNNIVWNYNTFALGSNNNFEKYPAIIYSGNAQQSSPFTYNKSMLPQGNYSYWMPANSAVYTSSNIGAINPAAFNFGDFNIEFWAWLRVNNGSTRTIMSTNTLINGSNTWEIVVDPSGNLVFSSYGKQIFSFPVYAKYNTDNWNHFLISRRSLTISFYINGQQVYQAPQDTVSWYLWPDNSLYLGYNPQNAYTGYNGTVALHDVRIVKGQALVSGAAEIAELQSPAPFTVDANTVVLTANAANITSPLTNNGAVSSYNTFNYNSNNIIWYFGSSSHINDSYTVTDKQDSAGNYVLQFGANKDWTMEAWIYPLGFNTGQIQVIASKFAATTPGGTTGTGWFWYLSTNGGLSFQDNNVKYEMNGAVPTLNAWNHVAVSYYRDTVANKNYFYMFLNGATVFDPTTRASATSTGTINIFTHSDNSSTLNIGTLIDSNSYQNVLGFSYTTSQYNFNGYINNFRVIKNQAIYKAVGNTPYKISNANVITTSGKTVTNFNIGTNVVSDVGDNNSSVTLSGNVRIYSNVAWSGGNLIATGNAINFYGLRDTNGQGDAAGNRGFVYVEPNKSNYQINDTGYTIQLWIQHNNNGQNRTIISYGYYAQSHLFRLYLNSSNNVGMAWKTGTDGTVVDYDVTLTSTPLTAGTWYNLALMNENGTVTFYVNGVAVWHAPFVNDSGAVIPILWKTNTALPVGSPGNYSWYFHNYNANKFYTTDFLRLKSPVASPADIKSGAYNFGLENFTLETWIYNLTDNVNPPTYPTIWETSPNYVSASIDATVWPNNSSPMPYPHNGGKYSVYIDGNANSNIMITPGANFNFGTGDFTIEYWSLLASDTGDVLTSNTNNWGLIYSGAGIYMQSKFYTTNAHSVGYPYNASVKLRNGSWHHYAYVKTAGKFNIYIDGNQIFSEADTTNYGSGYDNSAAWYIGYNPGAVSYTSSVGYYSNFRVANVAVYTGNFAPPQLDLAKTGAGSAGAYASVANVNTTFTSANCLLLTLQGSTIQDASDYSSINNLTVNTIPGNNTPALGGTVTTVGQYTVHQFTTTSNVTFLNPTTVDMLIVGAGGGGGGVMGGGGGGGGVIYLTGVLVNAGTHLVTVGGGNRGGYNYNYGDYEAGIRGGNSSVTINSSLGANKYEVWGGGGGGSYDSGGYSEYRDYYNGGSGGGASASGNQITTYDNNLNAIGGGSGGLNLTTTYGSVTSLGSRGGNYNGSGSTVYGAGGGGAGGRGGDMNSSGPGNGGVGYQSDISGTATYYAGGGGGGSRQGGSTDGYNGGTTNLYGTGGLGGGGNGTYDSLFNSSYSSVYNVYNGGNSNSLPPPYTPNPGRYPAYLAAQNGQANTGGGGGGGGYRYDPYGQPGGQVGGNGGSGVVFIRYLTNNDAVYNDPQIRVVEKHYTDPDYYNLDITNSISNSYYFGPANAILTVGSSANNSNWDLSAASWTVECWIKLNEEGANSNRTILTRRANSSGNLNTDYWFGISSNNNKLMISQGGSGALTTNFVVPVEKWTHVAYCYNGTNTLAIYADGKRVAYVTNALFVNSTNPATSVTIGGNADGSQPLQGYISNLRYTRGQVLYSGALTDTFTPSTTPLTTSTVGSTGTAAAGTLTGTVVLLTAQDVLYNDNSSNNYTLTSNKGAYSRHVTSQNAIGAPDNSLYFYADLTGRVNLFTLYINNIGQLNGTRPVRHNAWQHIAIVKNKNYIRTYVDGNLDINYAMSRTDNRYPINSASEEMFIFNMSGISGNYESGNGPTAWFSGMRFSKKALYTTDNFIPFAYHSNSQPVTGNIANVSISEVSLLLGNSSTFSDTSMYNYSVSLNGAPFIGKFNNNDQSITPPNGPWYTWFMGSAWSNWKDSNYDFLGNIAAFAVYNYPAITYNAVFTVPNAAFYNSNIGTANGAGVSTNLTGNVSLLTAIVDATKQMDQGLYNLNVNVYGAPTASQILNQFNTPNPGAYSIKFTNGSSVDLAASSNHVFAAAADFTIEFWMFVNNANGYQVLLDQYADGTPGVGNWRVALADGQIIWNYDGKNYIRSGSSTQIKNNNWTHIALQRRGGSLKILVNGADTWWTAQDTGWPYAGGNFIANSSYVIHQFTTSTTWYMPDTVTADILVVAGGGAGGTPKGGGGGAGGLTYRSGQTLTPGSYTIVVGAGGTSATATDGTGGGNSMFTGGTVAITTIGGGGGAHFSTGSATSGGSGGGGAASAAGGTGVSGQGNSGGAGYGAAGNAGYGAGGGGGAGAAGESGGYRGYYYSGGGRGGMGVLNSITGTAQYYAGGGGGGSTGSNSVATGGLGGGGAGGCDYNNTVAAASGVALTGGGGGGASDDGVLAGSGGSGVVYVKYLRTSTQTYPTAVFNGTHGRSDMPIRMGNVQTGSSGLAVTGYLSNMRISRVARYQTKVGNFIPYTANLNASNTLHTGSSVTANITANVFLTATAGTFADAGTNNLRLNLLTDNKNSADNIPQIITTLPYKPSVVLPNGYQSVIYNNSNLTLANNSLLYNFGKDDFTVEYWMYPTKGNAAIFNTWGSTAQTGYGMSLVSLPFSVTDQNANYDSADGTVIFYPIIGSTLKLFVQGNVSAEVIMAGAGGGGGAGGWSYGGGGGGGGGVVHTSNVWMQTGNLLVVIGAGGTGASSGSSGSVGGDTYIMSINMPNFKLMYANGGGYGGDSISPSGQYGGSGGGAYNSGSYGLSLASQGYRGGMADSTYGGGGGGGGAGGRGLEGRSGDGGAGGLGYQSYIGTTPVYFAAGGGGGGGYSGILRARFGFGGASGLGGLGTGGGVDGQGGGVILSSRNAINAGGGGGGGTLATSTGIARSGGNGGYGLVQMKLTPVTLLKLDTYINGQKQSMIANVLPTLNTWNHIALTQHNKTTSIWVNGQFAGNASMPITQSYTAGNDFKIGSDLTGNVNNFAGQIADFRIVKGQSLYNANFAPSKLPLSSAQNVPFNYDGPNAAVMVLTAQKPYYLNEYSNGHPYSNSVYLDGTSWIEFDLPMPVGTQDFTLECWAQYINPNSWPQQGSLADNNVQTVALSIGTVADSYAKGTQLALKPPQDQSLTTGLYYPTNFSNTRAPDTDYDWSASGYGTSSNSYPAPTWHHIMVVRQWNNARTQSYLTIYCDGVASATSADNSGYANFNLTGTKLKIGRDFAQYSFTNKTPNNLNGANFTGFITNVRFAYHAVIQNPYGTVPKDASAVAAGTAVFVPSPNPLDPHAAGHMPLGTAVVRDIPAGKCGLLTLQSADVVDRGDFSLNAIIGGSGSLVWDNNYLYPFSKEIFNGTTTTMWPYGGIQGKGQYANISAVSPFGLQYDAGVGSVYFPAKNNTSYYTGQYIPALQMGTQDFTFEAWVYPTDDALDNWNVLCSVAYTAAGNKGWIYFALNVAGNHGIGYYITLEDGTDYTTGSQVWAKKNSWSHVAFTKTGDYGASLRVFLNGKDIRTNEQKPNVHSNVWVIGTETGIRFTVNGTANGEYGFIGYLSNLRIIKGQSLYTETFTPPRTPFNLTDVGTKGLNTASSLTGGVSFLAFTTPYAKNANTFVDSSTYNWPMRSTGIVFQGTQTPFPLQVGTGYVPALIGGAAEFDGLTANLSIQVDGNYNDEWALRGNPFTIETWIKDINTSGKGLIISSGSGYRWGNINANNYSNIGFSFGVDSNGLNGVVFANLGNLQFNSLATSSVYNVGTWNHIAVTRDWPIYANGYSWSFDGGQYSYVTANTAVNPNINVGMNDFTLEFWVYPKNNSNPYPVLFSTSSHYSSYHQANVLTMFAGHTSYNYNNYQLVFNPLPVAGTSTKVIQSNANVNYNTWTHIAINRQNANLNLFINGNIDSYFYSNLYANNFVSFDNNFYIGSDGGQYNNNIPSVNKSFYGLISNWRLAVGNVSNYGSGALYANGNAFTVPTSPLSSNVYSYANLANANSVAIIANTQVQLLTAQDQYFSENSGQGYNVLNVSGNVTTQAVSPFGSNVNLWINGVNAGAFTSTNDVDQSAGRITIGSDNNGFFRYGGYMSQLRVTKNISLFKSAFTPASGPLNIQTAGHTGSSVYSGNITGNVMLLMSSLNLGILPDYSGTSFVVPYGNASVNTSVVKFGSGSVQFNGYSDYLSIKGGSQSPYQFTGDQDFTVEFWVYCNDIQRTQVFYDTRPLGVRTGGYVTAYLYYNPATTQGATNGGSNPLSTNLTNVNVNAPLGDASRRFTFTLPISSTYNYAGYFAVGSKVFITPLTASGAPGSGYVEGVVYSYQGTTLTVDLSYATGSGSYSTWIIQDSGTAVFSCDVGTRTIRATSVTVQPRLWTFITICRKNQILRFFINGIQQGPDVPMNESLDDAFDRPFFGVDSSNMANYFNGYMDDIRISRLGRYDTNFSSPTIAFFIK